MNFNFLAPKQPIFFKLFKELSQEVLKVSNLFDELANKSNKKDIGKYVSEAKKIENRADEILQEMIFNLNKSFITPFDREDIHTLVSDIDDIVDMIENVIHNISIYNINYHENFLSKFSSVITECADSLDKAINILEKMEYSDKLRKLVLKIHNLEDEGDRLFIDVLTSLFADHISPIKVIKNKDIVEDLERVIDKFQTASTTVENIVLKMQ